MLLFLAGLLLGALVTAFAHKKVDAAKVLILGFGIYLSAYAFVSGVLMLLDLFYVFRTAVITDIVLLVVFVIQLCVKRGERPRLRYTWLEYIPLAIILLAATFISRGNIAGYYGTGQDQGLYQIRALYYYTDRTQEEISFYEYENITESKYEKQSYLEEVYDLIGYNFDKEKAEEEGRITGVLHGLGVLPAMMALWGRLFGLDYMNHIMMLCFLVSVGNVWLICRNIKEEKKLFAHLAALLYAVSPIVVWCGLNTLTEIVLTMFITSWFLILSAAGEEGIQLLSIFPLGGMCVIHIMSTALIPLVVMIYWGVFFIRGKKSYLLTLMFVLAEYGLGFSMMKVRYGYYTDNNYKRIFDMTGGLLNADNMLTVVWTASIICMVISLVFMIRGRRELIHGLVLRISGSEKGQNGCRIAMIVLLLLTAAAMISEFVKRMDRDEFFYSHMTITGYIIMTGIIIFPAAVAVMVVKGKEFLTDRRFFALSIAFIYSILLYCKLLMPEIWRYYYFIRYLSPFIFIPIVLAGMYAYVIPRWAQISAAVLFSGIMLFQSRTLYKGQDLSYCSYRLLEDITSCIGEDDAVLINEQGYHCQRIFAFPVKALSGADVYYVRGSEIQKQMKRLDEEYDTVFLLSIDTGGLVGEHTGWKPIFKGYATGGAQIIVDEGILPYPNDIERLNTPIVLMVKE